VRVCLLTTCFPRFAGDHAGVFILSLARALAARGLDVDVVAPHGPGAARRETVAGVRVHRFAYAWPARLEKLAYEDGIPDNIARHKWVLLQAPAFLASAAAAVARVGRRADVIHAFWTPCGALAAPAARLWRVPLLVTLLGDGIRGPALVNRIALSAAAGVVCSTEEMAGYLRRYRFDAAVFDIKHMPDADRLSASAAPDADLAGWCGAAGGAVVTFIGRLVPFKDPLGFVRAVPAVLARHRRARFLIVGDGPLKAPAERLAGQLGVAGSVRFTGSRHDVGAILRASAVFVANSPVSNCYSTTILEAMTVGVPAVVTDAGDPTGSFKAKDYVESVRPADPADLARGIDALLADPARRARRAEMGRQFLVDLGFHPDIVVGRTLEAYQRLIGARRRATPTTTPQGNAT